jgi:hypothetical protein
MFAENIDFLYYPLTNASVVELVDTPDSKSGALKSVTVRVRPLVPLKIDQSSDWFFLP